MDALSDNMKNYALFTFAIMFIFSMSVAHAALPVVFVENVDPQPAEPGQDITVDVTFFNNQNNPTTPFSSVFEASYPFIFKTSTKSITDLNLCSGCRDRNTYYLIVDPQATSGSYPVYVRTTQGGANDLTRIDIKIIGKPNLVFTTTSTDLDSVTPNAQFAVSLDVENIGSGEARQVRAHPDSTNFIVIGSAIKTISSIKAGESKVVEFDFAASSSLTANSYSIPFTFNYLDDRGNNLTTTQTLGVKVVNKGAINIQTVRSAASVGGGPVTFGQPFTTVVRIENSGEGDAESIVAEVSCPFNGAKKAFVGRLEKDEDAPAVFEMTSTQSGTFKCDLTVNYKDDTGEHVFADKFDINVEPPNYAGISIQIIIILVVIFIFRKRILSILGLKKQQHHK